MSRREIKGEYWWAYVDEKWEFVGQPRTWVYEEHAPTEPTFTMVTEFEYHYPRHDAIHGRRVKGFLVDDLEEAMKLMDPEDCDAEIFRYQPDPDGGKHGDPHLPQIDPPDTAEPTHRKVTLFSFTLPNSEGLDEAERYGVYPLTVGISSCKIIPKR